MMNSSSRNAKIFRKLYVHYPGEYVCAVMCKRNPTDEDTAVDRYDENKTMSLLPELTSDDRVYFSMENATFLWNDWYDKTIFELTKKITTFCLVFTLNNWDLFEMESTPVFCQYNRRRTSSSVSCWPETATSVRRAKLCWFAVHGIL